MHKQHTYGKRDDSTFLFSIRFSGVSSDTISALLFDENDMEVTLDTWLEQTGSFIERVKDALGDKRDGLIDITATNEPEYSLACETHFNRAREIQDMIENYISSLSHTFIIEHPAIAS